MEHEFFGLKKKFGIEIEIYDSEKKTGKARFWINENPLGEFKVKHTFSYLFTGLKELLKNQSMLWDERFQGMTKEQIVSLCWFLEKDTDNLSPNDVVEYQNLKKFSPFFGDQFDTVSNVIFISDNKVHFIWTTITDYSSTQRNYLKNLQSDTVDISNFNEVTQRFLKWYEEVLLKK